MLMRDEAARPALTSVVEREREFYDRMWATRPRGSIEGTLTVPGLDHIAGKRVLICSCGSGEEAVQAARAGAEVYAFDISAAAVDRAKAVAADHGVHINVDVMDFHHLTYPDECFDAAVGSYILHHVDCALAGRELFRVLKPGGIGVFWENSDHNPILRWCRRLLFGVPGGQRDRFLGLRRHGTRDEYPLTDEEIEILRRIFNGGVDVTYEWFCFAGVIHQLTQTPKAVWKLTDWIDTRLGRVAAIRPYSFYQTVHLRKSAN